MTEKEVMDRMVVVNKWTQRLMYSMQLDGFPPGEKGKPQPNILTHVAHSLGHIREELQDLYWTYENEMRRTEQKPGF